MPCALCCSVLLAVIREAAEAASASNGPFHGFPPWLVVVVGALVAALALWMFAKLMKLTIWLVIIVVLVGGLALAGKMFLGA